mgnify:CR=1 FL=1
MKYMILIVMFLADPSEKMDSVKVKTLYNKPLVFESYKKCSEHVQENLEALKGFGRKVFEDKAIVKQILCVEEKVNA